MAPFPFSLQRRVVQVVGLLWSAGCQPTDVSVAYDSGIYNPDGTGGGTGEIADGYVDCGDVPELTEEMLLTGYVDSALLCQEVQDDGSCPTVEAFSATEVLYDTFDLETMGWGYDVWATCGPDASRLDACCYEVTVSE